MEGKRVSKCSIANSRQPLSARNRRKESDREGSASCTPRSSMPLPERIAVNLLDGSGPRPAGAFHQPDVRGECPRHVGAAVWYGKLSHHRAFFNAKSG